MKKFYSIIIFLVFAFSYSVKAQCPGSPAGCPGCAQKNPSFIIDKRDETCAGASDGSLQFLNLGFPDGMSYPLTYEWYEGSGCAAAPGPIITGTLAGGFPTISLDVIPNIAGVKQYTLLVYDGTNYAYSVQTINITDIPPNEANITGANLFCSGGSTTLTANEIPATGLPWDGNDTFEWLLDGVSQGPGLTIVGGGTTFSASSPGGYQVVVDNGSGCTDTSTVFTLTQVNLTAVAIQDNTPSCFGVCDGDATVTPAGGTTYSYLWSSAEITQSAAALCAGTQTVTVTETNVMCTVTANVTIDPGPFAVTLTAGIIQHETCFGGSDGSVSVTNTTGGTPPPLLQE